MTDETSRPNSEDMPTPPASTRWTEEPLQEDDSLASPFVPGRSAGATRSLPDPASSGEAGPKEASPWEESGDTPTVPDATVEEVVPEPGAEETAMETAPDTFPFEQFDLEDEDEGEAQAQGAATEVDEDDAATMGWTPADLHLEEVTDEPAGVEPAREAAEVLERLAGLLRSGGMEAVRGEMGSSDRLTSLLAGLLAGYVTGRS